MAMAWAHYIVDYSIASAMASVALVRERELQFADLQSSGKRRGSEATIRLRELAEHRHALLQIQEMAAEIWL